MKTLKHYILIFIAILLCTFSFIACSDYSEYSFGSGIDPSLLDSLSKVNTEEGTVPISPYEITDSSILFWTKSGSKFHIYSDCQAFSHSDEATVFSGSYTDAINDDHDEPCKFCLKKANADTVIYVGNLIVGTDENTSNYDESTQTPDKVLEITDDDVLFWTKTGSKIHLDRVCQSIAKTDESKIITGNYSLAISYGQSEFCKFCLNKLGVDEVVFVGDIQTPEASIETEAATTTSPDAPNEMHIDQNTVFYWTKSGTKLHFYRDCSSLAHTADDKIKAGIFEMAKKEGKMSPCAFCLKRCGIEEEDFPLY